MPQSKRLSIEQAISRAKKAAKQGDTATALQLYNAVLQHQPNHPVAKKGLRKLQKGLPHNQSVQAQATNQSTDQINALVNLYHTGQMAKTEQACRKLLQASPQSVTVFNVLGMALQRQGKLQEAVQAFDKAIELEPDYAEAYSNRGNVLKDLGMLKEAVESHDKAIGLKPDYAVAYSNRGNALKDLGMLKEAVESHDKAIGLKPDYAGAYSNRGNALKDLGMLKEAVESHDKAIELKPGWAKAYCNRGNALRDLGNLNEAVESYGKAIKLKPDYADAYGALGGALKDLGKLNEAVEQLSKALSLKPDDIDLYSNYLFCLNYLHTVEPDRLFNEHKRWAEAHGNKTPFPDMDNRLPDPERRLKVGYVSPDFRRHSVAFFLESLFSWRSREDFEIFCYADVKRPDTSTEAFRGASDHWRDCHGLTDQEVFHYIQNDGIDILIDLAGLTADHRMSLFSRRVAPVQVTWLGYPGTTGLPTMDYRITDAWADPVGETERYHTEELVRLPHGFLCYRAHDGLPDVAPLPAMAKGYVTFGSFNDLAKVTPQVVALWARILKAVPGSRLLMKNKSFSDEWAREHSYGLFEEQGIERARLEFVGWASRREHYALYGEVDIGLDTFPYNGTTTTCEALWMGVPVITLAGKLHAGRVGVSLLSQVGLEEWIVASEEQYFEIACRWADELEGLGALRAGLRGQMASSSLCDGKAFARKMEQAYRTMWKTWCAQQPETMHQPG